MSKKIESMYHNIILVELLIGGTQCTYVTKNRLRSRRVHLKTSHVLVIMKKLESLGFVSSVKSGLGYSWTLTPQGRKEAKELSDM